MSTDRVSDAERIARAALTRIGEPGDTDLVRAIREHGAVTTLALLRRGRLSGKQQRRWETRVRVADGQRDLEAAAARGMRLVCPGDLEWPTQLDDLDDRRPIALWVRGATDLRTSCLRSVSLVGARAATAYGAHVTAEMAATLGERDWVAVSGGAYGIDAAAHRGALGCGGVTVVVLACGLDVGYPRGHVELFERVAREGLLVSEWPLGATPTRPGFLVRNRVIAALSRGTVVVEAAARSGALSTAREAAGLLRQVMAVPGPVTSRMSTGCHTLLREYAAVCVTDGAEIIEQVGAVGQDVAVRDHGPVRARDVLDDTTSRVLEALPARGAAGPAEISARAGVDVETALGCLSALAAAGFLQPCLQGWRLARGLDRG